MALLQKIKLDKKVLFEKGEMIPKEVSPRQFEAFQKIADEQAYNIFLPGASIFLVSRSIVLLQPSRLSAEMQPYGFESLMQVYASPATGSTVEEGTPESIGNVPLRKSLD